MDRSKFRAFQMALVVTLFLQVTIALAASETTEEETETNEGFKSNSLRRQLPGNDYFNGGFESFGGMGGSLLLVVLAILVLCCLCGGRLSICDMLACVCIYELCCDDGNIGGFNLL